MSNAGVLLLEMELPLQTQLGAALRPAGFDVVEHAASAQASRPGEAQPWQLIIMGPAEGAALAQRVSQARALATHPVAVMVVLAPEGVGEGTGLAWAANAGVEEFVLEPVNVVEVVARAKACVERLQADVAATQQRRDAAALLELSQTLASSLPVPLMLHSACRLVSRTLGMDRCAVVMVDAARGEGVLVAASEDRTVVDLRVSLARYPEVARVLEDGAPLVVEDLGQDPLLDPVRQQCVTPLTGTALLFPILMEEKVHGVLFLRSARVRPPPDERELQLGQTVANATGVAIRNARLTEGLRPGLERMSAEHERAQERLRDLQRYEAFFEDAADGMFAMDGAGVVLYANREGARQFGHEARDLAGRRVRELLAADSATLLNTVLQEVLRGRFRKTFDLYVIKDNGEERCLACSAGAVGEPGTPGRVCMISFRDVTETREMQGELKTTKEFLENLIDSSVDAIIAADIQGNCILFNKGAEKVYGWRSDEVIGKINVSRLYPPGVAEDIMVQLRSDHYGGKGKLEAMRKFVRTKDGEDVPVSLTASIITEAGDEVATVGIFTDLRERIKIEAKLAQAQERLMETEKAAVVAQLAGAAAHELNQPLTSVLGYAEMLRRRIPEADPSRRSVDIIFREGERMADIVRKIGRITRLETKHYVGNTLIVDLDRASNPGEPRPANPKPEKAP